MKYYKEHIYSLEERQESDISPLWQFLQVLFFIACVVFGFTACFSFGRVMNMMQYNCILFCNLSFHENGTRPGHEERNNINTVNSDFHEIYCNLVIYIPIVVSTFACFFGVMFVYCGRGGSGNQSMPETWRIIMPTIFFNLLSLCLSAYSADVFQSGLKDFLKSIANAWHRTKLNLEEIAHLCLEGKNVGSRMVTSLYITKQSMWLLVCFWGLNFLWILLRCLFNVDFQLVRTTIHVYPKKGTVIRRGTSWSDSATPSLSDWSGSSVNSDSPSPSFYRKTVRFTPSTALGFDTVADDIPETTGIPSSATTSPKRSSLDKPEESEEHEIAQITYEKR